MIKVFCKNVSFSVLLIGLFTFITCMPNSIYGQKINVTNRTPSSAKVSWTKVQNANTYELKVFKVSNDEVVQTVNTSDTVLTLRNLTPSVGYYLKVKATGSSNQRVNPNTSTDDNQIIMEPCPIIVDDVVMVDDVQVRQSNTLTPSPCPSGTSCPCDTSCLSRYIKPNLLKSGNDRLFISNNILTNNKIINIQIFRRGLKIADFKIAKNSNSCYAEPFLIYKDGCSLNAPLKTNHWFYEDYQLNFDLTTGVTVISRGKTIKVYGSGREIEIPSNR